MVGRTKYLMLVTKLSFERLNNHGTRDFNRAKYLILVERSYLLKDTIISARVFNRTEHLKPLGICFGILKVLLGYFLVVS